MVFSDFLKVFSEVPFWVGVLPAVLVFIVAFGKHRWEVVSGSRSSHFQQLEASVAVLGARVSALEARNDELSSRLYSGEEYISILRNHIYEQLPPPPPDRP